MKRRQLSGAIPQSDAARPSPFLVKSPFTDLENIFISLPVSSLWEISRIANPVFRESREKVELRRGAVTGVRSQLSISVPFSTTYSLFCDRVAGHGARKT